MATLSFSFDTGSVPLSRIVDDVCLANDYQDIINGSPNPETKSNFARRMVRKVIIDWMRAAEAARQTALASVDLVTLT